MDAKSFWQLLGDVCQLGEFIAGIEAEGAEINVVGRFQVAYDGHEMVLEKQDCKDHFHLAPAQIRAFHFGYCGLTTGGEDPCIELVNVEGRVCLRLFYYPYQVSELKPKWEKFVQEHQAYRAFLAGQW